METRANFALIGAFAIAVVFAAFGFVFWISGPSQTAQSETYEIVFRSSVAGLSKGSSVNFNGLKVGEVTQLALSGEDPSRVDVLVNIDRKTPIKNNTKARLEMTGLTGVGSIGLLGGTPDSPVLVATPGQRYPVIQADNSEIQNLLENFQRVSIRAATVLEKLDQLLDANSTAFTAVLKNAETFTKTLAANTDNVGALVRDAAELAHSLRPLAGRFDKLLSASETTIKAIDPKKLKTIAGEIAGASRNLNRFSATGLRQYEQLAIEGRTAVDAIDRTVRSLERDPSQVIFGNSQTVPEVQGK